MADERRRVDPEGHVFCAFLRRKVDLERCLACRRLVEYDVDAQRPFVICRGPDDGPLPGREEGHVR